MSGVFVCLKKSSFYHVRFHKVGINENVAAEVLGVSVDDVLRWDVEGAPMIYERYLLLWSKKVVGVDGWDGFYFSRGVLRYKKFQWTAYSLIKSRSSEQENIKLKREIIELESFKGSIKSLFRASFKIHK